MRVLYNLFLRNEVIEQCFDQFRGVSIFYATPKATTTGKFKRFWISPETNKNVFYEKKLGNYFDEKVQVYTFDLDIGPGYILNRT